MDAMTVYYGAKELYQTIGSFSVETTKVQIDAAIEEAKQLIRLLRKLKKKAKEN
jgi:hypothetical protein